jgi:hypothetical protein
MDPYRPMVIDNRMPRAQFLDGNPMTDGLANLFASAINAPLAAGQIRRQREQDDRQTYLQDQQLQRQAQLDQRAETWRGQDLDRQSQRDDMAQVWQDAQIGNMQADNARQLAGMFGSGVNNAARRGIDAVKALRGLFAGRKGQSTPASSLWYTFKGDDGGMYKINRQTGEIVPAVPAATPVAPTPEAPVLPAEQPDGTAGEFPEGPGSSFWTPHRSGEAGVGTVGDLLGGLWDGWTGNGVRQGRAGDPSVGGGQPAPAAAPAPAPTVAPGAPPVEPQFIAAHTARLSALPGGPQRQDYLRRLKAGNPALYAALIQSLTAQR